MAVQAQYPSNVRLLNRGVLEGKNNDYLLQPQPGGGGFMDQSHVIFSHGVGTNARKRGRELTSTTTTTTSPVNPSMNSFSIQTQPGHQLIDLTQLHNPPPPQQSNVVSTGLRLAFGEQQQQVRQQYQIQQQQQQTISPQSSSGLFSSLSEDFGSHIRQQTDEIEQFIQAQGEQLRHTLADKRQRHYRVLLGAAEESVARRMKEKEVEVENAVRRNAELEARAAQLIAEAQLWQARARAQEATAASLQAQLQQAIMGSGCAQQQDRGEECAGGGEAEDAESAFIDPDRVVVTPAPASWPCCKVCRKRVASVIVLPCRHLCLCTGCGGDLTQTQACPLCLTYIESSVEVYLS